ncbi:MAG: CRTAC1 family protein [Planctomycetota bacterium]
MKAILVVGAISAIGAVINGVSAQELEPVRFLERSGDLGIKPFQMAEGMTGGVAIADYNNDGYSDIFVPTGYGVPDQLYRNRGNGHFDEIAAQVGLDSTTKNRTALFFDYDGDQDLDLIVASDCFTVPPSGADCLLTQTTFLTLYRHDHLTGQFTNVTFGSGIDPFWAGQRWDHVGGLAAGDLNNDSYVDLVVGTWGDRLRVYLNNGNGTFTESGIQMGFGVQSRLHWQPVLHDFNRDGGLDIFLPIDNNENLLYLNDGSGTFTELPGAAGMNTPFNEMGVALGDYDNDGDFDVFCTNIYEPDLEGNQKHNVFFRNDSTLGNLVFTEISAQLGVQHSHWGWGTTWIDCHLDGLIDLAATNGFDRNPYRDDPAKFWINTGNPNLPFIDQSDLLEFNNTLYGGTLVAADLDRDGDQDLIQANVLVDELSIFQNRTVRRMRSPFGWTYDQEVNAPSGNWITIRPRIQNTNHYAIGAVVRITVNGVQQSRLITAGTSCHGQEPYEAHFGIGDATSVDNVFIEWPNAIWSGIFNVDANEVHTIVQPMIGQQRMTPGRTPCYADCALGTGMTGDGVVNVDDLLATLQGIGSADISACDVSGEDGSLGVVDVQDVIEVINSFGPCQANAKTK